ncbi:F-box protein At5g39450 isoform X1 [Typha latifolia]|uniref:F-box protein At5g39450 isoform X1 n=1 Tax=Typha latifolia TaxID=4733 RepID=UPI003C2CECC3
MSGDSLEDGADFFLSLPDDVLALVSLHLLPRDLISLSLASRRLLAAVSTGEKSWLAQCRRLGPPLPQLRRWRSAVSSYLSVCRFLSSAASLLGVWVHQNPELGNVVVLLWGFLSVIAVRVIPQEINPLGLEAGRLLYAPVFEIVADDDGSPTFLFLHGRNDSPDSNSVESLYPGVVRGVDPNCNVLLLEIDVRDAADLVPFSKLAFGDRRRLLDLVAGRVRLKLSPDLATVPLFPRCQDDLEVLAERRLSLIRMHKNSGVTIDCKEAEAAPDCGRGSKRRDFSSMAGYLRDGFMQFLRRSNSGNRNGGSIGSGESRHAQLNEFLSSGDEIGLSLRATHMRLTTYRVWPNMHDNRFALYKLPLHGPSAGREYAGLWGGTFGWPPGRPSEDKPGKALFFLLLSYEEVEGRLLLIATKILEGTHYVLHPNGSSMFIVNVNEPASEEFPWETDGESFKIDVKHIFAGEGIANGYGFRYPGSKPGSLFVLQNGQLAFVWQESKAVLTLQRLDLEELLRKGECVAPLPPIANFAYLTKSYSNVFAGFHNNSSCSSPR